MPGPLRNPKQTNEPHRSAGVDLGHRRGAMPPDSRHGKAEPQRSVFFHVTGFMPGRRRVLEDSRSAPARAARSSNPHGPQAKLKVMVRFEKRAPARAARRSNPHQTQIAPPPNSEPRQTQHTTPPHHDFKLHIVILNFCCVADLQVDMYLYLTSNQYHNQILVCRTKNPRIFYF